MFLSYLHSFSFKAFGIFCNTSSSVEATKTILVFFIHSNTPNTFPVLLFRAMQGVPFKTENNIECNLSVIVIVPLEKTFHDFSNSFVLFLKGISLGTTVVTSFVFPYLEMFLINPFLFSTMLSQSFLKHTLISTFFLETFFAYLQLPYKTISGHKIGLEFSLNT